MPIILRSSLLPPFKSTSHTICGASYMEFGGKTNLSFTITASVLKYIICISAYVVNIHTINFIYLIPTKISFKITLSTKLSIFHSKLITNGLIVFTLTPNTNTRLLIASNTSPHKALILPSDKHQGVTKLLHFSSDLVALSETPYHATSSITLTTQKHTSQ